MARDKLITVRIEGEKRQAFTQLAKSQNTDTASLLYDFISGCLDGRIDIKLVTGKGNRLDNQLDSERIDKLETTTQRLDERVGQISKKLNDWVEAFSDRLNDCDQGLSHKMISLEHRLSTLSIQLDSQRIDSIDTDSQQIDDMEPLIKQTLRLDHLDDQSLIDAIESRIEDTEIDESVNEPDKGSIGPVPGEGNSIESVTGEAVDVGNRQGLTNQQLHEKTNVPVSTIEKWKGKIKEGEKVKSTKYPDFFKQWSLNLDDSLWYEVD